MFLITFNFLLLFFFSSFCNRKRIPSNPAPFILHSSRFSFSLLLSFICCLSLTVLWLHPPIFLRRIISLQTPPKDPLAASDDPDDLADDWVSPLDDSWTGAKGVSAEEPGVIRSKGFDATHGGSFAGLEGRGGGALLKGDLVTRPVSGKGPWRAAYYVIEKGRLLVFEDRHHVRPKQVRGKELKRIGSPPRFWIFLFCLLFLVDNALPGFSNPFPSPPPLPSPPLPSPSFPR